MIIMIETRIALEAPIAADIVESSLDEADVYAEQNSERLTHEEVFSTLRRKIDG